MIKSSVQMRGEQELVELESPRNPDTAAVSVNDTRGQIFTSQDLVKTIKDKRLSSEGVEPIINRPKKLRMQTMTASAISRTMISSVAMARNPK